MEKAALILSFLLQINLVYIWYMFRLDLVYRLSDELATLPQPSTTVPELN